MGDYILVIYDDLGDEIHRQAFVDITYDFMNEYGNKISGFYCINGFTILDMFTLEEV